jgi:hypothetical protein
MSVLLDDVRPVCQAVIDIDVVNHFLVYIAVAGVLELEAKVTFRAASATHVCGPGCVASVTGLNGNVMKPHFAPGAAVNPGLAIIAQNSNLMALVVAYSDDVN